MCDGRRKGAPTRTNESSACSVSSERAELSEGSGQCDQCTSAFAASAPVNDLTSISATLTGSGLSFLASTVPR